MDPGTTDKPQPTGVGEAGFVNLVIGFKPGLYPSGLGRLCLVPAAVKGAEGRQAKPGQSAQLYALAMTAKACYTFSRLTGQEQPEAHS